MRGHITQRAKGSWSIVLDLGRDPSTGKRKQKWVTVRGTKKDAEKKLTELQSQLDSGDYVQSAKLTLGEFLHRWLRDYVHVPPNLSPETAQGYDIICREHLMPALGHLELAKVTPEVLQAYYSKALKEGRCDGKGGLAPRTVRHHHTTLHTALGRAVKWHVLARNPADAVDAPRFQRKEMRTLDETGLNGFLESIQGSEYHPLFYAILYTGMRRSEALAVRWIDLDLILGQLSINRTLHHLEDGTMLFRAPKTPKSRRMIALTPTTSIVLRDHYQRVKEQRATLGIPLTAEDLVFAHEDGSPLLPHSVTNAWKRLVKRAGYQGIRLHDARHSHVSLMLKQGVDPKTISERLGHSSVVITLDTYAHLLPGMQEAAARGFDEGLSRYKTVAEPTT